jgi:hypothetical protein
MSRSGALWGRAKQKALVIGEAGTGHSFISQAEGPITIKAKGVTLPLLSRTIFATQVQENILSVTEAVGKGYAVIFNSQGVFLYDPKDVDLRGAPVLAGVRDKATRLFYFDFPSAKVNVAKVPQHVPTAGPIDSKHIQSDPSAVWQEKATIMPLQAVVHPAWTVGTMSATRCAMPVLGSGVLGGPSQEASHAVAPTGNPKVSAVHDEKSTVHAAVHQPRAGISPLNCNQ